MILETNGIKISITIIKELTVTMGFLAYHLYAVMTKKAAQMMLILTATPQTLLPKNTNDKFNLCYNMIY